MLAPKPCRYHSEEGWTAAIRLILSHYGTEVEVCRRTCLPLLHGALPANLVSQVSARRVSNTPISRLCLCSVQEDASHIFVAIVPVVLDSIFKYW